MTQYLRNEGHRRIRAEQISTRLWRNTRGPCLLTYPHHKNAPIDNNETERAIRPITISRKTSLFLGSVEQARGASLCYSLMECCRLHGVNQFEYMNDVLKIIETYPKEKLSELLPHSWKKTRGNHKAPFKLITAQHYLLILVRRNLIASIQRDLLVLIRPDLIKRKHFTMWVTASEVNLHLLFVLYLIKGKVL